MNILLRNFPDNLWAWVKAQAALDQITLREWLERLIKKQPGAPK